MKLSIATVAVALSLAQFAAAAPFPSEEGTELAAVKRLQPGIDPFANEKPSPDLGDDDLGLKESGNDDGFFRRLAPGTDPFANDKSSPDLSEDDLGLKGSDDDGFFKRSYEALKVFRRRISCLACFRPTGGASRTAARPNQGAPSRAGSESPPPTYEGHLNPIQEDGLPGDFTRLNVLPIHPPMGSRPPSSSRRPSGSGRSSSRTSGSGRQQQQQRPAPNAITNPNEFDQSFRETGLTDSSGIGPR